jgi:hypothetical protein
LQKSHNLVELFLKEDVGRSIAGNRAGLGGVAIFRVTLDLLLYLEIILIRKL